MAIHFKFRNELTYDRISFNGLHISVADLKKAIFHQKRIGRDTDFDLQIVNPQTKEQYTDDNALIARNSSVIVMRMPLPVQQKRSWNRVKAPTFSNAKDEAHLRKSVDLTRLNGSEEDKIRAMMTLSSQDYDPSNYMKIRGSNQTGEVPPNYRCYKCHQPGHWIKNCPLEGDQKPIRIKKSTGIPRSFMVPVEGPSIPGAMMTPDGTYAVAVIDQQAYKEEKMKKRPFFQDPEPVEEKPAIPLDLLCNICKDLLTDAAMIPCCGKSFCDECIRTLLLESEERECPACNEKDVSPDSLIPNRHQRNAVLKFEYQTGYAKSSTYKPSSPQSVVAEPVIKVEPPISEKHTVWPSTSAATPAPTPLSSAVRSSSPATSAAEADVKEANKPIGQASPSYEKAAHAEPVIEACYRVPPPSSYSGGPAPPPPSSHNPPLSPDPYMAPPRMPMYPIPQQPPGPPPAPAQRYDGRPPYQQQLGYRPNQPPSTYSWPPGPVHGMHYSEFQRNNLTLGVIDDPLEAFERMLREKDERDRRLGKHRSRQATRSRSRSQSYSRSGSRSRSPPRKRRKGGGGANSRSPSSSSRRARSPTSKKRRSPNGSFSSSSRYHKDRNHEREWPRSRGPYKYSRHNSTHLL